MTMYSVPFDNGQLTFDLPRRMSGTLAKAKPMPPLDPISDEIKRSLAQPVGSPPLRELAKPGDKVCIVFTDATRASPDHLWVPPLLAELKAAGVRADDITLLCGTGLHRPSTPAEKAAKLGQSVVASYRVLDNEPHNPAALVDLGTSSSGIPLLVNRIPYEADLVIATGIVEPHHLAGYSGGRKTLAIGAAGKATIASTHGPHMVDQPHTRLGRIAGNPFHEAVTEIARQAGLRFIVNGVLDDNKRVVALRAGEPSEAFLELVACAKHRYTVPIAGQYDVVVAGVDSPKDKNLYQATRAASYLYFAPQPVIKPGGCIILPATCPEGAGMGSGEQSYYETMKSASDMSLLLAELRENGYPPGAQRAFFMARVLEENSVIVVGAKCPPIVRDLHMIAAADIDEAFQIAIHKMGRADLDALIVPHALSTLPIVQE